MFPTHFPKGKKIIYARINPVKELMIFVNNESSTLLFLKRCLINL